MDYPKTRSAQDFVGRDNIIPIHVMFLRYLGGDYPAAALLAQLLYWSKRTRNPEGWVAKTYEEWDKELVLSKFQVARAVKLLKMAGVETKLMKWGGAPTVHYRINMAVHEAWRDKMDTLFFANDNQETELSFGDNLTNDGIGEFLDNPLTEITLTENTYKNPLDTNKNLYLPPASGGDNLGLSEFPPVENGEKANAVAKTPSSLAEQKQPQPQPNNQNVSAKVGKRAAAPKRKKLKFDMDAPDPSEVWKWRDVEICAYYDLHKDELDKLVELWNWDDEMGMAFKNCPQVLQKSYVRTHINLARTGKFEGGKGYYPLINNVRDPEKGRWKAGDKPEIVLNYVSAYLAKVAEIEREMALNAASGMEDDDV